MFEWESVYTMMLANLHILCLQNGLPGSRRFSSFWRKWLWWTSSSCWWGALARDGLMLDPWVFRNGSSDLKKRFRKNGSEEWSHLEPLEPPPTFSVGCCEQTTKRKHVDSPRWAIMKLVVSKPLIEQHPWHPLGLLIPYCPFSDPLWMRLGLSSDAVVGVVWRKSTSPWDKKRFKQQNFQRKIRQVNWVLPFNWVLSNVFGCSLRRNSGSCYRAHCVNILHIRIYSR